MYMKKMLKASALILIIASITYYYKNQKIDKPEIDLKNNTLATTTPIIMGDNMFIAATQDADATILAKGDLNSDKLDDAIVVVTFCGASCSLTLNVVLNIDNKSTKILDNVTFDGYKSSSATKSDLSVVKIENGIITLIGKGLDCEEDCNEEKWNIEKTIQYKLEGDTIVKIIT